MWRDEEGPVSWLNRLAEVKVPREKWAPLFLDLLSYKREKDAPVFGNQADTRESEKQALLDNLVTTCPHATPPLPTHYPPFTCIVEVKRKKNVPVGDTADLRICIELATTPLSLAVSSALV